jgi:tetratricopeptide (TPR) repeat protein
MGRYEDAASYYDQWVVTDPTNVVTWLKLGEYYAKQERWEEALERYRRAYELAPTEQEVTTNLVAALSATGRNGEANQVMVEEIHAGRDNAVTWGNLGCIERKLGRNVLALRCYERALEMDPKFLPAQWGRSLCLLALGRLEEGWADYECGMRTIDRQPKREFPQPRWEGQDLRGKTILVWMEQGLGDHIAWASMLPDLVRAGARELVESEYRLVSLFERSFPAA